MSLDVLDALALSQKQVQLLDIWSQTAASEKALSDVGILYGNGLVSRSEYRASYEQADRMRSRSNYTTRKFLTEAERELGDGIEADKLLAYLRKHHLPTHTQCALCGSDISHKRREARWCDNSCYQRAYRIRTHPDARSS